MIRKMQNPDTNRVADIWLKTNLKAHYFISELSLLHIPQELGSSAIIRIIQPWHTLVLLLKVLCYISHT